MEILLEMIQVPIGNNRFFEEKAWVKREESGWKVRKIAECEMKSNVEENCQSVFVLISVKKKFFYL